MAGTLDMVRGLLVEAVELYSGVPREQIEATLAEGTPEPAAEPLCIVCHGTGRDPHSDTVNWLPCSTCGGKNAL